MVIDRYSLILSSDGLLPKLFKFTRVVFVMQENLNSCSLLLVHSALVASSLHLLSGCISSQWQDLVQVLLAHPKVHIFHMICLSGYLRAMG